MRRPKKHKRSPKNTSQGTGQDVSRFSHDNSHGHHCKTANTDKAESPNNQGKIRQPFWQRFKQDRASDQAMVALTSFLAVFTLCIVAFNLFQITEYRKAVRHDLRAYVVINEVQATPPIVGQRTRIRRNFINVGKTPAYNVSILDSIVIADDIWPDQIDSMNNYPDNIVSATVLGAGGVKLGGDRLGSAFSIADSVAVFHGGKKLFIFGSVIYSDNFGDTHFTEYVLAYDTTNTSPNMTIWKQHRAN